MKRRNMSMIIGAVAFLFTGCSLLPMEEELRTAPIISSYKAEEYKYVVVEKGDLQSIESISCVYQPTTEEVLSFAVSGERYDIVYVQIGDVVQKGDLLAELEMEDVLAAIEESEISITKLDLQHEYLLNQMSIEKERLAITGDNSINSPTINNYETQITQVEDAIYIAEKRLQENIDLKLKRQIYAGMDGIVSNIKAVKKQDKSIEGERFITVTDPSLSFTAKINDIAYFPHGKKADILVGEDTYATTVIAVEEDRNEMYTVKFALDEPTTNLEQGVRGTYKLILEEKKNILYVLAGAVTTSGEQSIAYGVDEDGFKTIKTLEIGMYADGKYEIVSGLSEGEKVILE